MQILEQHSGEGANINSLRFYVNQFILKHLGPDTFKSLADAIMGLFEKGMITAQNKVILRDLSFSNDEHLMAAWDAYTVLHDENELADTLNILCNVR
jgi:hypothetical protein